MQPAVVTDLMLCGLLEPQKCTSFNSCATDREAFSNHSQSTGSVLEFDEQERMSKCSVTCESQHFAFTPTVVLVDGQRAMQVPTYIKGERLSQD